MENSTISVDRKTLRSTKRLKALMNTMDIEEGSTIFVHPKTMKLISRYIVNNASEEDYDISFEVFVKDLARYRFVYSTSMKKRRFGVA